MRKHKSVVAILLAVMMIFTFMPTMAFADTNPPASKIVSWSDMYSKATGDNDITFDTERSFASSGQYPGYISSKPVNKVEEVVGGQTYVAPNATATYYDLDGSSFVYGSSNKALDGTTWTQEEFDKLVGNGTNQLKIKIVEPTYTKEYQAAVKAKTESSYEFGHVEKNISLTGNDNIYSGNTNIGYWVATINDFEYVQGLTTDQTVTFSIKSILPNERFTQAELNGVDYADLFGTVATATVTVKGKVKTPSEASFYLDEVGGTPYNQGVYDGKTHTVVVDETPGYTWSYQVRSATSGKYEDVSAVTITDVQSTPISFKAFYTDSKGVKTQKGGVYTLNLSNTTTGTGRTLNIGWDSKNNEYDYDSYGYKYTVPGTEYDAASYVTYTASKGTKGQQETAAQTKERLAKDAAAESAVTSNEALIKEWFNTYYQITDVSRKSDAGKKVTVKIEEKNLTAAEKKAADEKFAQLERNLGTLTVDEISEAEIVLNGSASKDIEVEFTDAPSSKVVHVKKAKKLKKNVSFTVKAEAANGSEVVYKLINANNKIKIDKSTGKITLNKGLAKGTYKIKVKAYIPEKQNGVTGSETQAITIKIKK